MRMLLAVLLLVAADAIAAGAPTTAPATPPLIFRRGNLVAWCIVPYDGRHRSPEERAEMLDRIGLRRFAYDWRAEHLPTFDRELNALGEHHIELVGVWFPDNLGAEARMLLNGLKRHGVRTQLWVTGWGYEKIPADQRVAAAVDRLRPIAAEAAAIGCTLGLYNHGGWFGEPENQVKIVVALNSAGVTNVGIVYNVHHGYGDLDRFDELFAKMRPYLLAVNLNGTTKVPPSAGESVVPVGRGLLDVQILRTIRDSDFRGPIGIINESQEDAEARLLDNIEGVEWVASQLDGQPGGPRPQPRSWHPTMPATMPAAAAAPVDHDYWSVEDAAARAKLPVYQTIPAARADELTPANGWPAVAATWSRSHGSDADTRYSPLAQINRDNVKSLKVAWTYHSGDGVGNIQCNPVIVDGVMYAPTVGNDIAAVDADTGHERWRFKPTGEPRGENGFKPAVRGLLYHAGGRPPEGDAGSPPAAPEPAPTSPPASPRLIFPCGNYLWQLDPRDGKPIASFGDNGKLAIPGCVVAPVVFRDVLIFPGYNCDVFGVDLATGSPRWTFHTVPRAGEPFADTWDKPEWGANCWGGIALDASRGIAYVTTGSPKPNFVGVSHRGDNLFANCVIALDAQTGTRLWHFQELRHDIWDLDIAAPPVLVTVTRDGRKVDAVAAVTKIGNTLLLDRVTGKPLFPFRLRRAPASKVPGERTSPYQPDPELPEPFARPEFTKADVTDISPAAHRFVLDLIEKREATFGWFRPPEVDKPLAMFGVHGGAEWTGASFDPATGLLYVSSNRVPWFPMIHRSDSPLVDETKLPVTPGRAVYHNLCIKCHGPSRQGLGAAPSLLGLSRRLKEPDVLAILRAGRGNMPSFPPLAAADQAALLDYLFERDRPRGAAPTERPERPQYAFDSYPRLLDALHYPGCKPPWGQLTAIDLSTGKISWQTVLGEDEELTRRGIPKTGTENFGGPTVTAGGLVFCAGTRDRKIRAFDASTGQELWSHTLPFGGFAPPAVYEANGKQYVVIPATGGGKLTMKPYPGPEMPMGDAYVAFALP